MSRPSATTPSRGSSRRNTVGTRHRGSKLRGAQDGAHEQALGAGVRPVVQPGRVDPPARQERHQQGRSEGTGECGEGQPELPATAGQSAQGDRNERPEQVELLLDRQRPRVQQRRRLGELVEVTLPGEHEPPVRAVAQGGQRVGAKAGPVGRVGHEVDVRGNPQQRQHQSRGEAAGPANPERLEADAARALPLGDQQGRDEKARQREEHVHREDRAGNMGDTGVVEQHVDDADAAQAVQRRHITEAPPPAARGGAGRPPGAGVPVGGRCEAARCSGGTRCRGAATCGGRVTCPPRRSPCDRAAGTRTAAGTRRRRPPADSAPAPPPPAAAAPAPAPPAHPHACAQGDATYPPFVRSSPTRTMSGSSRGVRYGPAAGSMWMPS